MVSTAMTESASGGHVAIEVHDLTVSYHTRPVLWNVDFEIPEGRLVAIIGPNGAGKTTLIKAILGLLPLSSGWIKIFNRPYSEVRTRVGYVPQRESVDWDFPTTVLDVVTMGRHPKSDIFLDDITVSRRHAEVRREGSRYWVRDVGSLNGTYVNRERADDRELLEGDELQIGKFKLVFVHGTGDV